MKHLYIVVDLAKRKVVFESDDLDLAYDYERKHQEKALYLITLDLDEKYPALWGLDGVVL